MSAVAAFASPRPRTREEILAGLPALAAAIAEGASEREKQHVLPFEQFKLVRASGLGTLRIGREQGGPGGSIEDVIHAVTTLAAADSNVAHALRTHFNTCELLRLGPPEPHRLRHIRLILEGALFGGAFTEQGTARAGQNTTRLVRVGNGWRLRGRKYYTTGTAFADYASVFAFDDEERGVNAVIPVTREGVEILDDWDGMGQNLTASSSMVLNDVEVFEDEIAPGERDDLAGRHASALRQLILVATAAGIVRNVVSDAVNYVRRHGRPAMHSPAETAREDHFVQLVIGELGAASHAIDVLVADAARQLDRSAEAILRQAPDADDVVLQGALTTARTQLVVSRLALAAAERMFEAGGASATSRKHNFDRHWRNLRTIFSHNPLQHKARILGDHALNGTKTHLVEGRVF
ncbi:acyl-CoA dehydrogenase family protein [Caldimonas thermodepolymerans]|uniref:Dibenzothiophene monooxygenase n=1 Tax=Caldimonas thermodepolymerans TaxID=215580 RepID=A0A2S5T8A0_9BURK|nr:acyl-CoA dehydrogenase family protein [Caldimonas thermodepolymerans]PPE71108.1 acyl-CoA dehydrogenase [Caldimonas thermodepolymerans]QPC31412.1 acyl-CoA dehydrogenase family protein [Caldimonas thermodepolymerans]RDH99619.1 alkylation response protein AidB-like acyl-CoA dehydrogenase [Caldimonas thermodepolymerans]